jgi:hypothetical protein
MVGGGRRWRGQSPLRLSGSSSHRAAQAVLWAFWAGPRATRGASGHDGWRLLKRTVTVEAESIGTLSDGSLRARVAARSWPRSGTRGLASEPRMRSPSCGLPGRGHSGDARWRGPGHDQAPARADEGPGAKHDLDVSRTLRMDANEQWARAEPHRTLRPSRLHPGQLQGWSGL